MSSLLVMILAICRLIVTVGLTLNTGDLLRLGLSVDKCDVDMASIDFGWVSRVKPLAVLKPSSAEDVVQLVEAAYNQGFTVSARGNGHSVNGQAQTGNGVVVQMSDPRRLRRRGPDGPVVSEKLRYVDVWGGELWIDVLEATLEYGLAPRSWTDYLYLTVGGTLSNAGVSGQAFNFGPQISNVYELDVVTGKGELVTCSNDQNPELFHAVLGGLGQFGIITRARIVLEPAPQRTRRIKVLYSNFTTFTQDQEYLISLQGQDARFDYVEGSVMVDDERLINNWRSSFFSPSNPVKISSLGEADNDRVLYCIEVTKNYNESTPLSVVDQEVDALLQKLNFIPATVFKTDLSYVDFLDRVHKEEVKLRAQGLWDVPHPWLNLFVPKSRIFDFDRGVFKGILRNKTVGPLLIYPVNKNKWDERSSVVVPDEEVFYAVALLRSALDNTTAATETQTLEYLTKQNREILKFCSDEGINIKQYFPYYTTEQEWIGHFGHDKWERFVQRKMMFDPKHILATGQSIFKPSFMDSSSSSGLNNFDASLSRVTESRSSRISKLAS